MNYPKERPARPRIHWGIVALILLNMLLCVLVVGLLLHSYRENARNQETVFTLQSTIDEQQALLDVKTISYETFEEHVAQFSPSTEFIQSFYDDRIVYKDESGVVYAPIDPSLPKNTYDFNHLTRVNGRVEYHVNGQNVGKIGIDVSKHQGPIDWERVKADGIDFAMIRLAYRGYGTGKLSLDESFWDNIQAASAAGMDMGFYVYSKAVSVEEAKEEAQLAIDSLAGYQVTYPVVIDIEEDIASEDRIASLSARENTDMVVAFCETIREAGYTPMIYANAKWFVSRLDMTRLTAYDKWLAQYYQTPFFPYALDMWQYSSTGSVDGIDGNVDLNICFTDYTK